MKCTMERLTYIKCPNWWNHGKHPTKYSSRHTFQEVVDRLAAYEGTGLTPEEVAELVKRTTSVKPYAESGADRLCGHCYSYIDWDALNDRVEDAPKYCKSCGKPIDWSDEKGGAE